MAKLNKKSVSFGRRGNTANISKRGVRVGFGSGKGRFYMTFKVSEVIFLASLAILFLACTQSLPGSDAAWATSNFFIWYWWPIAKLGESWAGAVWLFGSALLFILLFSVPRLAVWGCLWGIGGVVFQEQLPQVYAWIADIQIADYSLLTIYNWAFSTLAFVASRHFLRIVNKPVTATEPVTE